MALFCPVLCKFYCQSTEELEIPLSLYTEKMCHTITHWTIAIKPIILRCIFVSALFSLVQQSTFIIRIVYTMQLWQGPDRSNGTNDVIQWYFPSSLYMVCYNSNNYWTRRTSVVHNLLMLLLHILLFYF